MVQIADNNELREGRHCRFATVPRLPVNDTTGPNAGRLAKSQSPLPGPLCSGHGPALAVGCNGKSGRRNKLRGQPRSEEQAEQPASCISADMPGHGVAGGATSQRNGLLLGRTNDTMAGPTRSLLARRFLRLRGQRCVFPEPRGEVWRWLATSLDRAWGFNGSVKMLDPKKWFGPHKVHRDGATVAANGQVLGPSHIKCMDRRQ
jgi:hypothetical protein